MIEVMGERGLAAGRRAGRFVGRTLDALRARAVPGTNLLEIDEWTRQLIEEAGAVSCYVDYAPSFGRGPFGKVICTSVNDAVLHGLPHDYVLADGDLLSLDLAVSIDGCVADAATSFVVGGPADPEDERMIEVTRQALAAGIASAGAGRRIGDISHAIGSVLRAAGYRVNTDFGGHGVGSTMHQDPHIANDGRPGRGLTMVPGMLLAIEPWVMRDTAELTVDADGWTLRSATGCRTAHVEHTVAITDAGVEILTPHE
ncbi:type I methionyl aminopeptidase [Propionicimonas sp.]|uniref:type I methionyl aminopeptidase n=1 Tax=Propionicimonas sp. TaxID=1955623 RepID=UPI003D10948C